MWYTLIFIFLISLIYVPTVEGQCPPREQDIKMIIRYLERVFEEIKSKFFDFFFNFDHFYSDDSFF